MKIFGKSGALAKHLPDYQDRPQQIELANAINKGLKTGRSVVVEAPTGVGKSLGALVPMCSRLHKDENKKYIICTATIALQEQYINKELPFLRSLGFKFSYGLMKGMSNYICPFKFAGICKERKNPATEMLRSWLNETETGDLSELSPQQRLQLASMDIRASFEECLRTKCHYYESCPYFRMRDSMQGADIIVVNYHYFLSHLKLLVSTDEGVFILLPRVTNILFDEAHVIKDTARDFFGYSISRFSLNPIIKYIGTTNPDTADALSKSGDRFFSMLDSYLGGPAMRLVYDLNAQHYGDMCSGLLVSLMQTSRLVKSEMDHFMEAAGDASNAKPILYARRILTQISNVATVLNKIELYLSDRQAAAGSGQAAWVERNRNNDVTIAMKPLFISGIFAAGLSKACNQATFMSATLDHKALVKDLGLSKCWPKKKLIGKKIKAVFDYGKQAALYVPSIGEPNSDEYDQSVAMLFADLCKILGGGILGLFTSYKSMAAAEKKVNALPEFTLDHPLLIQDGTKLPAYLAQEFRKGDRVLIGTKSFFQGVDFPGECVKVVFINQIPFKHYLDPITQTLKRFNVKNWFDDEQLQHAKILFKQAFGRLIRRETDTGLVICCDERLFTKYYGQKIIGFLPEGLPIVDDWNHFNILLEALCQKGDKNGD